jgi:hypothetical protein
MDEVCETPAISFHGVIKFADSHKSADTPSGGETIGLGVAIGSGVGASLAISQGGLVGTALVTVYGAGVGGLAASGYVGWKVGTWLGEREIVRDNLLKAMEALFPIESKDTPQIEIKMPEKVGEKFSVLFNGGQESYDFSFYMDALGEEGFSSALDWNEGLEYFSDPWAANEAAEKAGLLTPEYEQPALIGKNVTAAQQIDVMLC